MAALKTREIELPDGSRMSVGLVYFDAGVAQTWLDTYHFARQRPIAEAHVRFLSGEMEAGRFAPCAVCICECENKLFLTDGRHRLTSIVATKIPQWLPVLYLRVSDYEAVGRDYVRRDINKTRTVAQSYKALALDESTSLSDGQVTKLGAAVVPITCGFTGRGFTGLVPEAKSRDLRATAINDWGPEGIKFFELISGGTPDLRTALLRLTVMSIALVTLRHQSQKASEFWGEVALNDGLKRGEPQRTLADFLLKRSASSMSRTKYSRGVATAWNAYFEGATLQIIKVSPDQCDAPIRIAGTPYDGKTVHATRYGGKEESHEG